MNKLYPFFIFLFLIPTFIFSQVEDESCLPPKKKTLKLIDNAKKKAPPEASLLFREAISEEPDNAMAYYEFAIYAYNNALKIYETDPDPKRGDNYMKVAEKLFIETIERCSDYHSDCYYYLGIINYTFDQEKVAMKYFKQFQEFDSKEVDRYSKDHEKRLTDVAEVLEKFKEDQS